MSSTADVFFEVTLVGVGGTIVLDLYALMMSRVLGVPAPVPQTVPRLSLVLRACGKLFDAGIESPTGSGLLEARGWYS